MSLYVHALSLSFAKKNLFREALTKLSRTMLEALQWLFFLVNPLQGAFDRSSCVQLLSDQNDQNWPKLEHILTPGLCSFAFRPVRPPALHQEDMWQCVLMTLWPHHHKTQETESSWKLKPYLLHYPHDKYCSAPASWLAPDTLSKAWDRKNHLRLCLWACGSELMVVL